MLEPEVNGYPPNIQSPSLSQGGDVNNPTNSPSDLNPFIGNANLLNVPVFKSVNYVPGRIGWALFKDGTFDGFWMNSNCRVYLAADTSIDTSGGEQKILFDTATYDNLGEFDITTNNRFTATKAGKYLVNSFIQIDPSAADIQYILEIKKTGTLVCNNRVYSYTAGVFSIQITDVISLAVGDYIEIWLASSEPAAVTLKGFARQTFLNIHRLS